MTALWSSLAGRVVLATAVGLAAAAAIVLASDGGPSRASRSTGSWTALSSSPLERTEVGAARVGDRIYVVGGFISSGGTTGELAIYDISEDAWTTGRPLPIAVNHPGVTALGGKVYVVGGNLGARDGREPKSKRLYAYSPRADRWQRLPDARTERAALGLAGIGHRLYAAGGYSESDFQLAELEIYDIRRERWRRGPPMATGRNHVGTAVLGGTVVVTGGRPGPVHGGLDTAERYDPRRNRWSTLPPMPTARSGHTAVVAGGRLVVFGGEELDDGGETIEQVEAYDPRTETWGELPPMITPRHGLGGVARGSRVFAIEGGPRPGLYYSRALEYLDAP